MEPPGTYIDRIDPKYKDRAPHVVFTPERGDTYNFTYLGDLGDQEIRIENEEKKLVCISRITMAILPAE